MLNYTDFSKKIKLKYPVYNDIPDDELARKVISKYPVYKDKVSFETDPKTLVGYTESPAPSIMDTLTPGTATYMRPEDEVSIMQRGEEIASDRLLRNAQGLARKGMAAVHYPAQLSMQGWYDLFDALGAKAPENWETIQDPMQKRLAFLTEALRVVPETLTDLSASVLTPEFWALRSVIHTGVPAAVGSAGRTGAAVGRATRKGVDLAWKAAHKVEEKVLDRTFNALGKAIERAPNKEAKMKLFYKAFNKIFQRGQTAMPRTGASRTIPGVQQTAVTPDYGIPTPTFQYTATKEGIEAIGREAAKQLPKYASQIESLWQAASEGIAAGATISILPDVEPPPPPVKKTIPVPERHIEVPEPPIRAPETPQISTIVPSKVSGVEKPETSPILDRVVPGKKVLTPEEKRIREERRIDKERERYWEYRRELEEELEKGMKGETGIGVVDFINKNFGFIKPGYFQGREEYNVLPTKAKRDLFRRRGTVALDEIAEAYNAQYGTDLNDDDVLMAIREHYTPRAGGIKHPAEPLLEKLEKKGWEFGDLKNVIRLRQDTSVNDMITGQKVQLKKGHEFKPIELEENGRTVNKFIMQDGKQVIVDKSTYERLKQEGVELGQLPLQMPADVQEVVKESGAKLFRPKDANRLAELRQKERTDVLSNLELEEKMALEKIREGKVETKFSKYTLPGGENYREILLQKGDTKSLEKMTPQEKYDIGSAERRMDELELELQSHPEYPESYKIELRAEYKKLADEIRGKQFISSHWEEPNVLAHARVTDRTAVSPKADQFNEDYQRWIDSGRVGKSPDPKDYGKDEKVLFIEEIQSDWARAAREHKEPEMPIYDEQVTVPFSPHLKNWQELTLKRILKEAVEGNYDYIAWTTGEQQADRYDLSKHIDSVKWRPSGVGDNKMLNAVKDDKLVISVTYDNTGKVVTASDSRLLDKPLAEVVGKDMAKRAIEEKSSSLSGLDLRTGGEWAKSLYDRMIPNILKDLTKKWGGKIETISFKKSLEGMTKEQLLDTKNPLESTQQALRITPQIREFVKYGGVPMAGGMKHETAPIDGLESPSEKISGEIEEFQVIERDVKPEKPHQIKLFGGIPYVQYLGKPINAIFNAMNDYIWKFGRQKRLAPDLFEKLMETSNKQSTRSERAIADIIELFDGKKLTSDELVQLTFAVEEKDYPTPEHLVKYRDRIIKLFEEMNRVNIGLGIYRKGFIKRMSDETEYEMKKVYDEIQSRIPGIDQEKLKLKYNELVNKKRQIGNLRWVTHKDLPPYMQDKAIEATANLDVILEDKMKDLPEDQRAEFLERIRNLTFKYKPREGIMPLRYFYELGILSKADLNIATRAMKSLSEAYFKWIMKDLFDFAADNHYIVPADEKTPYTWTKLTPEVHGVSAPEYDNHKLHPLFQDGLVELKKSMERSSNPLRWIFSVVKMGQFIKPTIIWKYDILQTALGGAVSFKTPYFLAKSFREMTDYVLNGTMSQDVKDAYHNNVFQLSQIAYPGKMSEDRLINTSVSKIMKDYPFVKGIIEQLTSEELSIDQAWKLIAAPMKAISNFTFTGDKVLRLSMYKTLRDQGFSQERAAKIAREWSGAYNEVGERLASQFQWLTFVYAFRVLMPRQIFRLIAEPVKRTLSLMKGEKQSGKEWMRIAKGMAALLFATFGIDYYMKSKGYDKERSSMRVPFYSWVKPVSKGGKDYQIVTRLNLIYNQPIKWFSRLMYYNPTKEMPRSFQGLIKFAKWEIHPIWRILAYDIARNRVGYGRGKVFDPNADALTQAKQKTWYFIKESYRLIGLLDEERMQQEDWLLEKKENEKVLNESLSRFDRIIFGVFGHTFVSPGEDELYKFARRKLHSEYQDRMYWVAGLPEEEKTKAKQALKDWKDRVEKYLERKYSQKGGSSGLEKDKSLPPA